MNCECCSTPMIWFGSMSRGGLDCPKCKQDRPIVIDLGKAGQIAQEWTIPVPDGRWATEWIKKHYEEYEPPKPDPFAKYFTSKNRLTESLLFRRETSHPVVYPETFEGAWINPLVGQIRGATTAMGVFDAITDLSRRWVGTEKWEPDE